MAEEQSQEYYGSEKTRDLQKTLADIDKLAVANRAAINIVSDENTVGSIIRRSAADKIKGLGKLQGLQGFADRDKK